MRLIKNKTAVVPIIVMICVFAFGALMEFRHTVGTEKNALKENLVNIQTNIEHLITARIINANGMAGIIELNQTLNRETYDIFAKGIYASESGIVKDVVFIKDTTITYIYPEYLSKDAIGVDLADVPDQKELLLYTKNNLKEVFFGPVDLVEGGRGIVVRVPVALNGDYYGQIAIVFDYDLFIENSGLKLLSENYYIALKGNVPTQDEEVVIWSSGSQGTVEVITEKVRIDDIEWLITAAPIDGWNGFSSLFFIIIAAGFIVVIGASAAYKKEEKLTMELKTLAERDELTGLCNRRMFRTHLQTALENERKGLVVLVDIDDFKNINDIYGHIVGDKLLIDFSVAAREVIGDRAQCYRFGGDEFLLIFEGSFEGARIMNSSKIIQDAIQQKLIDKAPNRVTLSVGIVCYPDQGQDVDSLLIKADVAVHESKMAGKNRTMIFEDSMLDVFDRKMQIEKHIRNALDQEGFEMHYQPIVNAQTEEIVSYEALIRFQDRAFSPIEFITVAETSGLIIPLGHWILREVVSTIADWLQEGRSVKPVAINLSPKQLLEPSFRVDLFQLIDAYEISASLIELEITENILLENEEENLTILNDLRSAGISVSMDDFGTGYSSLKYLTFLPIDKVKIDKSLKDQFMLNQSSQILTGIIMMVHGLGYKVVAEGIETKEELEKLKELGCDEIQGYYFSRPLPRAEIEDRLK